MSEEDILDKISPGDIVLAKLKGFPWWPARIEADNTLPPDVLHRKTALEKQGEFYVAFFYGSLDYGVFSKAKLKPYHAEKVKLQLENKKLTKKHIEAIEQSLEPNFLDDYFKELKKIKGNKKKPSKKKITNKKRVSQQNSSLIKKENEIIQLDQENEAGIQIENDLKTVNIRNRRASPKKSTVTITTTTTPTMKTELVDTVDTTTSTTANSRPKRKIIKKRYFDDIDPSFDETITDNKNNSKSKSKKKNNSNNRKKNEDNNNNESNTIDLTSNTTNTSKRSSKKRKKLSESLVEAANKSPTYERRLYRIYHIRLSIQHLAFKKKQGDILISDYSKIDQELKQIEQWSMTLDFLKDTKLYKVIHNISKYEFENDASTFKLKERCLKLLWDWKSNIIDPYLKEMNYESKAAALINLPPI